MKDREFDDDEIDYLRSLPAVNSVGRNRIRYTDQFREYCMQRYRAGDSPTGIFRDVGLDPSLIGYKRIERCIARWKMMEPADDDAEPISADKFPRTGNPLIPPAPIRAATIRENFGGSAAKDLRDMLIAQQIRYIHELTAENDRLRERNRRLESGLREDEGETGEQSGERRTSPRSDASLVLSRSDWGGPGAVLAAPESRDMMHCMVLSERNGP